MAGTLLCSPSSKLRDFGSDHYFVSVLNRSAVSLHFEFDFFKISFVSILDKCIITTYQFYYRVYLVFCVYLDKGQTTMFFVWKTMVSLLSFVL